jgi:hypothetical protein
MFGHDCHAPDWHAVIFRVVHSDSLRLSLAHMHQRHSAPLRATCRYCLICGVGLLQLPLMVDVAANMFPSYEIRRWSNRVVGVVLAATCVAVATAGYVPRLSSLVFAFLSPPVRISQPVCVTMCVCVCVCVCARGNGYPRQLRCRGSYCRFDSPTLMTYCATTSVVMTTSTRALQWPLLSEPSCTHVPQTPTRVSPVRHRRLLACAFQRLRMGVVHNPCPDHLCGV